MISVVITAFNEAKNLPRAVASVKGLAGEIIVVDTESTDNTVEIARKLGCRVYTHKYPGIVEPVRNFSIAKAKGEWILLLDADEEVSESLKKFILEAVSRPEADYYRLPRKNLIFNKWIESSHWWPDYVYRLFRKGYVVWDEAIHSVPSTRGTGADFPVDQDHALIHHNYNSVSQYVSRLNNYTDFQLKLLLDQNTRFSWDLIITKPFAEFITQYFARRGYKDGLHGLVLASLQAFSELILYLKLWQQSGFIEKSLSPAQVQSELDDQAKNLVWWYYQTRIDTSSFIFRPFWKLVRRIKTTSPNSYKPYKSVSKFFRR